MDVKFNAKTAQNILYGMKKNCDDIVNDSRFLLKITDMNDKWKDKQSEAFKNNIEDIAKEINVALHIESEYLNAFREKVVELGENG